MKKRTSTVFLMWVMGICLHAHISIAAVSKSNGTTAHCDGSVEECLIVHHMDSQLPTISSSNFRRILVTLDQRVVGHAGKANKPFSDCKYLSGGYIKCGASVGSGTDNHCAEANYDRLCHNVNPS
ncbi:uncharacterized protein LOC109813301 [Cajanus cajan]|uniref:Uncharacterized protein n=1 Tax=Cajanus cajan TaxID=3821 RepID=A0A151S480_CAJCA|nr:uncharacterized protein LOC109813301 [Cajanus cajan]KYP49599.1 hypothetical protein KK1_028685 [Cajanus cajan]